MHNGLQKIDIDHYFEVEPIEYNVLPAFGEYSYEIEKLDYLLPVHLMGYTHVYGPDIDRDFYNPLYEEELIDALYRLNSSMPEEVITDALYKLKNYENGELIQKNAVFMDYIQHGIEVRFWCSKPTSF